MAESCPSSLLHLLVDVGAFCDLFVYHSLLPTYYRCFSETPSLEPSSRLSTFLFVLHIFEAYSDTTEWTLDIYIYFQFDLVVESNGFPDVGEFVECLCYHADRSGYIFFNVVIIIMGKKLKFIYNFLGVMFLPKSYATKLVWHHVASFYWKIAPTEVASADIGRMCFASKY